MQTGPSYNVLVNIVVLKKIISTPPQVSSSTTQVTCPHFHISLNAKSYNISIKPQRNDEPHAQKSSKIYVLQAPKVYWILSPENRSALRFPKMVNYRIWVLNATHRAPIPNICERKPMSPKPGKSAHKKTLTPKGIIVFLHRKINSALQALGAWGLNKSKPSRPHTYENETEGIHYNLLA